MNEDLINALNNTTKANTANTTSNINNTNALHNAGTSIAKSVKTTSEIISGIWKNKNLGILQDPAALRYSIEGVILGEGNEFISKMQKAFGGSNAEKKKAWGSIIGDLTGVDTVLKQLEASQKVIDFEDAIMKNNRALGVSGIRTREILNNIKEAGISTYKFNVDINGLLTIQQNYNDVLGTSVGLRKEEFDKLAQISRMAGLAEDSVGQMAANMRLFGFNTDKAFSTATDLVDLSDKYALNAKLVTKEFIENFEEAQKYKFEDGVEGFAKMVADSKFLKINIKDSFETASGFRSLEGSFEKVAQLQLLGGEFTKADPFRLMHLARTNVPEFQKQITSMFGDIGKFNEATGQIEFSSLDFDRIQQAQKLLGGQFGDVQKMIVQEKRLNQIKTKNSLLTEEEAKMVTNLATFDKNGITVKINDKLTKPIEQLTRKEIDLLIDPKVKDGTKGLEERIIDNTSLKELSEINEKFNTAYAATSIDNINNLKKLYNDVNNNLEDSFKNLGFGDLYSKLQAINTTQLFLIDKNKKNIDKVKESQSDLNFLGVGGILTNYLSSNNNNNLNLSQILTDLQNNFKTIYGSNDNFVYKGVEAIKGALSNTDLLNQKVTTSNTKDIIDKINTTINKNGDAMAEFGKVYKPPLPDKTDDDMAKVSENEKEHLADLNTTLGELKTVLDKLSKMDNTIAFDPLDITVNIDGDMGKITQKVIKLSGKVKNSGSFR